MKRIHRVKVIIVLLLLMTAAISAGFLANQETRDFRIAKNLDIFLSLFRELNTFYVDDINPDKVIRTGIDNMLKSLDPYTVYYPESEIDEVAFMTTGKYGGIGSLIRGGDQFAVISMVYKGFPADIAGIRAGDVLKKADGIILKGYSTEQVSEKLKGIPGTIVKITVERNGTEIDFDVKRERIVIPPVPFYGMIDSLTGYIRFTNFTQNCYQDVRNALIDLRKNNPKQMILDLSQRFKMAIVEVKNNQQIIAECLEALKEAQANKKDSLKERIRKISDYLLDIPQDVPPELYLSFNSRFHGTMF